MVIGLCNKAKGHLLNERVKQESSKSIFFTAWQSRMCDGMSVDSALLISIEMDQES